MKAPYTDILCTERRFLKTHDVLWTAKTFIFENDDVSSLVLHSQFNKKNFLLVIPLHLCGQRFFENAHFMDADFFQNG